MAVGVTTLQSLPLHVQQLARIQRNELVGCMHKLLQHRHVGLQPSLVAGVVQLWDDQWAALSPHSDQQQTFQCLLHQ